MKTSTFGIDASTIWGRNSGSPSGIVNYTMEITRGILDAGGDHRWRVYCMEEIPEELAGDRPNVEFRVFRAANRKLWQQLVLPVAAMRDRLDLLFFPGNSVSVLCPCKSVATVHDLHPFVVVDAFKEVHSTGVYKSSLKSRINMGYWRQMMRSAARKERVVAPSRATKVDLEQVLGTPPGKVDVVYEAVDHERFHLFPDADGMWEFREKWKLPSRYLLCVGTHGYKNLRGAIQAFAIVRESGHDEVRLVIAGGKGAIAQSVFELVEQLGLEESVLFTGFFPDEDLPRLYAGAEMLLFPSFYEGFGLPVLESFACGTPVVTSNRGSLPEVGGEAATLVDPQDPAAIAAAVRALLENDELRATRRELGLNHAASFTWERAARETLEVLDRAIDPEGAL